MRFFLFVSAWLAANAWAAPAEPLAFKGIALGAPITAVANDPRYQCLATQAPGADRICSLRPQERETMAGVPVNSIFWFSYRGRLTSISIHLDERHFQPVVAALKAKYGPAETRSEVVKNLKGESFNNHIHAWRQGGASLVAQRYAGRLDKSSVRYADEAAIREIATQRNLRKSSPESDL